MFYANYSAICAIAKDEDSSLRHWVDYHLAVGFEQIFIFDNNSTNPVREILREYVANNLVVVLDMPVDKYPQLTAYNLFLKELADAARWVAFIDIDEYICPLACNNINDFLSQYEEYAAIGIHWKMFGSNGHITRPDLSPVEAYDTTYTGSTLIKTILQPRYAVKVVSPHHFTYQPGRYCVNEHRIPIQGFRSYATTQTIQINHYYFKSQQDFEAKKKRGLATPVKGKPCYDLGEFYQQTTFEGQKDTAARKFDRTVALFQKKGPKLVASMLKANKPGNTEEVIAEISPLIIQGKLEKAQSRLEHALRYYDSDPFLLLALAKIHISRQNFDQAMGCVHKAMKDLSDVHPMRKQAYLVLAEIYKAQGMMAQHDAIHHDMGGVLG